MSALDTLDQLNRLKSALSDLDPKADAATHLHQILRLGLGQLPQPGYGATLERWQALAMVAGSSLPLAKLYEGHTDAMAILEELGEQHPLAKSTANGWGVWAAEGAGARVTISTVNGSVLLNGTKRWCSGAQTVSHGLLTAWHADGSGSQLVRTAMHQPGVNVSCGGWQAVGMAASASVDVTFLDADAALVGGIGDYLSRPGFWQGGAGIAACWYGGSLILAAALKQTLMEASPAARGAFRLAALGKVDVALKSTATLLREAATWIDDNPLADASAVALRARLSAEACATTVLAEAGRALGPAAFCLNARFAQAAADLPVFVRQSHAERDFAALAERVISSEDPAWSL